MKPTRILIRGTGEIASAVACLLHRAGGLAALQASRPPIAIRRLMAFSDAVFDGTAQLDGLTARRIDDPAALASVWAAGEIPLLYRDFALAIRECDWDVLVDARMNKQHSPEAQRGLAPLVIGMGPGCAIGRNVDVAVETSWDELGRILRHGETLPLRGEPRAVLGHARDRFRYAPQAGLLQASATIGQVVRVGEEIARIGHMPICAVFDGVVRGITRDGVPVESGNKIAEIDPRIGSVTLTGIDHRPRRIAEAVAAIVADAVACQSAPMEA
ncbi:xanthine dehydrogenase [Paramagnetospirillum kuznetsovii]|uniref:Xanthine dehydrogenase n=2 Tax=Paramagnetospirillum kuznetsovii TaxID=2053833 RepID=A0A364P325_9PROT|nr:xanthine dehydrogenase [Paramagnetospirillum kuznetsovii]